MDEPGEAAGEIPVIGDRGAVLSGVEQDEPLSVLDDVGGDRPRGVHRRDASSHQYSGLLVPNGCSGWICTVNIQVPGLGVAVSNRGLRSSVGRGVAVVGEHGFRDDCGL